MTIPVPLSITDTLADAYYGDENRLGAKLAQALNEEIRALAEAGCTCVQVIFTPDCGLGLLDRNTVLAKITHMVTTAKSVD
jgi:methionine synthase II (cobalamin-independent)